jgi:hypothetical protein
VLILVESIMNCIGLLFGGMPTLFHRRESFGDKNYWDLFVLILLVNVCTDTVLGSVCLYANLVIRGVIDPE